MGRVRVFAWTSVSFESKGYLSDVFALWDKSEFRLVL